MCMTGTNNLTQGGIGNKINLKYPLDSDIDESPMRRYYLMVMQLDAILLMKTNTA